jgi:hypothetical protein
LIINDRLYDDMQEIPKNPLGYEMPDHIRSRTVAMSKQKFLTGVPRLSGKAKTGIPFLWNGYAADLVGRAQAKSGLSL